METTRVTVIVAHIDMSVTNAAGDPATISAVDAALCPHGGPGLATVWVRTAYNPATEEATIPIAGADVADPPANSLTCPPDGAELWAWPISDPEKLPGYIDRVEVV